MSLLKIFVINLAGSCDRRERMSNRLNELGCEYTFFEAVDGRENPHPLFKRYDDDMRKKHRRRKLSGGELGCWASHFLLWEKCVELNQPIIVMEDDIEINTSFYDSLAVVSSVIEEAGYLRLSAIYDRAVTVVRDIGEHQLVRYLREPAGTQCYVITPQVAKIFLQGADVWYLAVDEYMDKFWRHGVDSYALWPFSIKHGVQEGNILRLAKDNLSIYSKLQYEYKKLKDRLSRSVYNFKHGR